MVDSPQTPNDADNLGLLILVLAGIFTIMLGPLILGLIFLSYSATYAGWGLLFIQAVIWYLTFRR